MTVSFSFCASLGSSWVGSPAIDIRRNQLGALLGGSLESRVLGKRK